jgi:hypothetical protein
MQLLDPLSNGPRAWFLAFKGKHAPLLQSKLGARNVVTDVRGDVLRIGFGIYQNEGDVERLTDILKALD